MNILRQVTCDVSFASSYFESIMNFVELFCFVPCRYLLIFLRKLKEDEESYLRCQPKKSLNFSVLILQILTETISDYAIGTSNIKLSQQGPVNIRLQEQVINSFTLLP